MDSQEFYSETGTGLRYCDYCGFDTIVIDDSGKCSRCEQPFEEEDADVDAGNLCGS